MTFGTAVTIFAKPDPFFSDGSDDKLPLSNSG